MRVRFLEKAERRREAERPAPSIVTAHLTPVATGGVKVTLRAALPTVPSRPPPDDVDVLANAVSRMLGGAPAPAPAESPALTTSQVDLSEGDRSPLRNGFMLVSECGWSRIGKGSYCVDRFATENEAKAAAAKLWCCWVLYREVDLSYSELASGGVGFACYAVRAFAQQMEGRKREALRVSRGEPPSAPTEASMASVELDPQDAWYDT